MINLWTPDGRRAAAFAALLGGCVIMTVFAAVGVYLVSGNATYSFYLALAAHVQIMLGLAGFTALFVRRTIRAGKDGVEIIDMENKDAN
jgi:hypothetical protein